MSRFRKTHLILPDSFCPRLREGVQLLKNSDLGFMLSVDVGKFTRISEQGAYLVPLLDGTRSLAELKELLQRKVKEPIPAAAFDGFFISLAKSNLLENAPEIEGLQNKRKITVRKILHPRSPLVKGDKVLQKLAQQVQRIPYPVRLAVMALLLINGVIAPTMLFATTQIPIITLSSAVSFQAVAWVMSLVLLEIVLHELSHGVALTMYGATVRGFGVGVHYFLVPFAYTDTSDSYRLRRSERIVVSLAGPAVDLMLLGVTAVSLFLLPPNSYAAYILTLLMGYQISVIIWNMNFFLPLDGYYIVADLLNEPALRQQGIRYWLHAPLRWLRIHQKKYTSRQRLVYAVYGVLLITYLAVFFFSAFSAVQFGQQLP